jgi:hypothetical protein
MQNTIMIMMDVTKKESLPSWLKKTAIVYQKVKHLDDETVKYYLANPELVLDNIDKFDTDNRAVIDDDCTKELSV